ncbi:hypothetical protein CHLRE_06g307200v5 [Chlamydomonas reinhardtii]|uniref:Negatively light-regulated protein n=2 Tax=Chlamydomonas TaxID=3052 RepID=A8IMV0_CHLRE|nr:uncharacterized protein CHLRE_06g307200v5 [Chlamydomonas reinhardtii]PNW83115.1 hypothetical protein CHLRE_06g307200v5 [Chlamydomonas reinhardtii]|eukprot:XP_001691227.1 predicted protein [Chlamydomonas reinhardtii]
MADQAPQDNKSAKDVEKEQEAMLMAKYGGLKPKKKLLPKDHKFFDSADWAMNKEAQKKGEKPPAPEDQQETLPPRLEPMPVPSRRVSHLDPLDK